MSYDRYAKFKSNDGTVKNVPFIKIPRRSSDAFETYERGKSRLDLLSYKYYNDANFGWLILQANPQLNEMEFSNFKPVKIRIPLPLQQVLIQYENDIENYKKLYSID